MDEFLRSGVRRAAIISVTMATVAVAAQIVGIREPGPSLSDKIATGGALATAGTGLVIVGQTFLAGESVTRSREVAGCLFLGCGIALIMAGVVLAVSVFLPSEHAVYHGDR